MIRAWRLIRIIAIGLLAIAILVTYILWRQWQIRGSIDDIGWPSSTTLQDDVLLDAVASGAATSSDNAARSTGQVTAIWLGTTTILFDDGETQVLIDSAFTKLHPLSIVLLRPVQSDIATINYALSTFRMDRLAAIVPVHSHFDHAIDVGYVANRTGAVVLGSESSANIARGEDVPVDQYQILADGESRQFGNFKIKLIASVHAPIAGGAEEFFPGVIEEPLRQPARVSAWKTGVTWSVIIDHPRGVTLVQGSGGFVENKLADEDVDVVMLGLGAVAGLGKEYVDKLWHETVELTGATRVIAVHHDDYTRPFGNVELLPNMIDNVIETTGWIDEIRASGSTPATVELPPFGQPIALY